MENEIMVNEEVMENVTEAVDAKSTNGFKKVAIAGLIVLAGVVAFKIGKKVVAKVKAAKEKKAGLIEGVEYTETDVKTDSEESED